MGRLRPYCQYDPSSDDEIAPTFKSLYWNLCARAMDDQSEQAAKIPLFTIERSPGKVPPALQQGNEYRARPGALRGRNWHDPSHVQSSDPCGASVQGRFKRIVCLARALNPRAIQQ